MKKLLNKIKCELLYSHDLRISYDEYICKDCGRLFFEWDRENMQFMKQINIFAVVVLILAAILFAYSILTYKEAVKMKEMTQEWVLEVDGRINLAQKQLEEMRLQCAQWTYGHD